MKRTVILLVALCLVIGAASAAEGQGEANVNVGDLMVNAGVNYGWYGFGVGGGVEYMFAKWDIPNFAPLTFGGAAKVGVSFGSGVSVDVAALGTMHFGLKTFSSLPEWMRNLDWYWGLGAGLGIGTYGGFGIATGSGICYYLNPTLAINADYFYANYFGSGSGSTGVIGIRLKL